MASKEQGRINDRCCGCKLSCLCHRVTYSYNWVILSNLMHWHAPIVLINLRTFSTIWVRYLVFRGANKQKHVFKKNPEALIWGKPPKVVGGKLLASGYWYDPYVSHPNLSWTTLIKLFVWSEQVFDIVIYEGESQGIVITLETCCLHCPSVYHVG